MKYIVLMLSLLLSACASTSHVIELSSEPLFDAKTAAFIFKDMRNKKEVSGGMLGFFTPAERIGEKHFSPPPIQLLKSKIGSNGMITSAGTVIQINQFEILHAYPKTHQSETNSLSLSTGFLMLYGSEGDLEDSVSCRLNGLVDDQQFDVVIYQAYERRKMIFWSIFESDNFKSALKDVSDQCVESGLEAIKQLVQTAHTPSY